MSSSTWDAEEVETLQPRNQGEKVEGSTGREMEKLEGKERESHIRKDLFPELFFPNFSDDFFSRKWGGPYENLQGLKGKE